MRPVHFQPYPAMLYKAIQKNPWRFESYTAIDENDQRNMESRGFVAGGQGAAAEAFDANQADVAKIAAARNYEDRNMSAGAKSERDAAEQASSVHLGEIPATPIKPRK